MSWQVALILATNADQDVMQLRLPCMPKYPFIQGFYLVLLTLCTLKLSNTASNIENLTFTSAHVFLNVLKEIKCDEPRILSFFFAMSYIKFNNMEHKF